MNPTFTKLALTATAVAGFAANTLAAELPKWPVQNGDLSVYVGGGLPAHWGFGINSGKFDTKMEQIKETWSVFPYRRTANPPQHLIVQTLEGGESYFYQTLPLLKGKYRIGAEILGTPGVQAKLTFSAPDGTNRQIGQPQSVTEVPQSLSLDVLAGPGNSVLALSMTATTGQSVKIRNFKMDVLSLDSAPIPFEKGQPLGGLVLPTNPSQAEQYAAYELQRYIYKMTGKVPGLKGRDTIHPGRLIYLGRATSKTNVEKFKGRSDDSYLITNQGNSIILAGKTDRGVLYAAYDFLNQQGYRWTLPGDSNETVPIRKTLRPVAARLESPGYEVRGVMVVPTEFLPGGGQEMGWNSVDYDEYFDWAVRNRLNAMWFAEIASYDFGAHRGSSWVQLLNHSYNSLVAPAEYHFKDHPEWYALVRGKRMANCDVSPFFPNQLCVSSPTLRDYTVNLILDYFKAHPEAKAFPLNPMDGPSYWCECDECKKLDPPGLDWSRNSNGGMEPGMTDRAIDYANEVSQRVAKVYPDKLIEVYAYSFTIHPPVKTRVGKNVMIKYANLNRPGYGSLGKSILDPSDPRWSVSAKQLADWKKMGTQHFQLYNYFDYMHPDASLYWFFNTSDMLKNLHNAFGFEGLMGEQESNSKTSPMLYQIVARTLWDPNVDYKQVIREVADTFYGPVAKDMYDFNMYMDAEIRKSTASDAPNWIPQDHLDLSLAALEKGRVMLETAAAKVKDDPILTERLAYARFGHAYLTYVRTLNEKEKTEATRDIALKAFELANALRSQYRILSKYPSVDQLKTFYYPPVMAADKIVYELPEIWEFKTDPEEIGTRDQWFAKESAGAWSPISTNADWTSQPPGHTYHGTAWYRLDFTLPPGVAAGEKLNLLFGAIDGVSEIYLDGAKIGESLEDPGIMWDKSFPIALPADFDSTKPHRLTVKVTKKAFAAGIWKRVQIVKADSQ